MPEVRRIKATYYPPRQAHPSRDEWKRAILWGFAAAIAAAIGCYMLIYVLTAF